uniref:Pre-rRNA-processing protein TSR2 n=1 Tax=Kalanchoe fedtschenkoi TaxID=63787 RepID=A0A7N0TF59_KALFE
MADVSPRIMKLDAATASSESISPARLRDGIDLVLSRWFGLQMAIENRWGGKDSPQKSRRFAADIFSLFSRSNGAPIWTEDLENFLNEYMPLTFNTEIEDGSIEEVRIF